MNNQPSGAGPITPLIAPHYVCKSTRSMAFSGWSCLTPLPWHLPFPFPQTQPLLHLPHSTQNLSIPNSTLNPTPPLLSHSFLSFILLPHRLNFSNLSKWLQREKYMLHYNKREYSSSVVKFFSSNDGCFEVGTKAHSINRCDDTLVLIYLAEKYFVFYWAYKWLMINACSTIGILLI